MATAHKSVNELYRVRFDVSGVVQGVGFRPFVCRLAEEWKVSGHVLNSDKGVRIEVEGMRSQVQAFERRLKETPPPGAQIDLVDITELPVLKEDGFCLRPTANHSSGAFVPPDVAVCADCLSEISDPNNRRYGYPFTNCAVCGPRYTIIDRMPFDRAATAMQQFDMCASCSEEYHAPDDRRYLAETITCPDCGPRIAFRTQWGEATGQTALSQAVQMLKDGAIVAVKGIGGFHLLVDAGNEVAVRRLREKKNRPTKPFAVMSSLEDAGGLVNIAPQEADLLTSPAAPIVLLTRRAEAQIAPNVAPDCRDLGIILPYTPLHHLIVSQVGCPLVATSANFGGEPIIVDETQGAARLNQLADASLIHNRPILRPADDSVCRVIDGAPQILRLGRGYAPYAVEGSIGGAPRTKITALGGHLKSAPAVDLGGCTILGPHVGDLGSLAMGAALVDCATGLEALYGVTSAVTACDLHPDYETTRIAEKSARPIVQVQHHLAHTASVIAEHQIEGAVVGFAWDGTGFGPDKTVWGGEVLVVDKAGWRRIGRLRPFSLPGGELAVREPRRAALGVLVEAGEETGPIEEAFKKDDLTLLQKGLHEGINTVMTSSVGRLFDACSALLGLCFVSKHEGAAAMMLEACAHEAEPSGRHYPFVIEQPEASGLRDIDWRPMIREVLRDKATGVSTAVIARAIHDTFAAMIADIAKLQQLETVALSGGCFQNRLLLECAINRLREQGHTVCINRIAPPGDGGLALGQAFWARRVLQENR